MSLQNGYDVRSYDVVALQVPIAYNAYGDHDHDGLIFALSKHRRELEQLAGEDEHGEPRFKADEPHPLVRPLVLRACVGELVQVRFRNHIRGRRVGLHLVGGGYDVVSSDGAHVGANPDTTVAYSDPHEDAEPYVYEWRCEHEGVHVFHDAADLGGTEDATNIHGLFGVLVVEPAGTVWRDPAGDEPATSADTEVDGLYVDVIPAAMAGAPAAEQAPWLGEPVRYPLSARTAFREYVIVFHDEPEIVNHEPIMQVRPPWEADGEGQENGGHAHGAGISHVMPISYRAEPMPNRERILWSRITGTPVEDGDPPPEPLEVPVVNEEQHHSSWRSAIPRRPCCARTSGTRSGSASCTAASRRRTSTTCTCTAGTPIPATPGRR